MVLVQSWTRGEDLSRAAEERQTLAASVDCATDASGAPEKHPVKGLTTILVSRIINRSSG
jgi:hypothetical protein